MKHLVKDLSKEFPRSPRETLGGYVIAARTLDKCRAVIHRCQGDYLYNCPLDRRFFAFTGISAEAFLRQAERGATDEDMSRWIIEQAQPRPRIDIIKWNNRLRDMRISELDDDVQEFLETYIPAQLPKGRPVYCWFDVYDLEEHRL